MATELHQSRRFGTKVGGCAVIDNTRFEPDETVIVQFERRYGNLGRASVLSEIATVLAGINWLRPIDSSLSAWFLDLSELKAQNGLLHRLEWLDCQAIVNAKLEYAVGLQTIIRRFVDECGLKHFARAYH